MDIEKKIELVKRKPTEEIVTENDLREIFENYAHPQHYIGFEISGLVHLGSGLCTTLKIRDMLEAKCKSIIWLADYHAWINGKLGGDLDQIQKIAKGYFKHAFVSLGLEEDKVEYKLSSEVYDNEYWKEVLAIAKDTTLKRMLRCVTIMGRKENEGLSSSSIFYPAMQAADIIKLNVQIAHAGMDQRKVHMLLRDVGHYKFAALHTHLLPGLVGGERMNPEGMQTGDVDNRIDQQIEVKMSKSKPDSAIFIHDSEEQIQSKIKKAYCPEKITEGNPMIEYAEYLILRDKGMKIERPEKFGGDLEIVDAEELRKIYSEGKLHPVDLKNAVSRELSEILKPSRDYFEKHKEYLEQIKTLSITR
ncbi:tyrosine--tRNA ligase [Candidatus Micrarchaeota archaeon]|nr:tyrosine--tRNA ligase [Candidatus Micrarchaeota archaeon]